MSLLHPFRFRVDFHETTLDSATGGEAVPLCSGSFSEITGFEATMEPFAFKEGGRNWGEIQRAGHTTFATLVLSRGMTRDRGLWRWFQGVANGGYAYRLNATVTLLAPDQPVEDSDGVLAWEFANCLPVKLKAGDLSASSSEIAIEELHLAHEGMALVERAA